MPILILSRKRPSLRWERISVSHSIAPAASPTAAKEPDKYRRLIGAMSAHGPFSDMRHAPKDFELRGVSRTIPGYGEFRGRPPLPAASGGERRWRADTQSD